MGTESSLPCSFCGREKPIQVKELIAGPDVFICFECVGLCNQIIADKASQADDEPERVATEPLQVLRYQLARYEHGWTLCDTATGAAWQTTIDDGIWKWRLHESPAVPEGRPQCIRVGTLVLHAVEDLASAFGARESTLRGLLAGGGLKGRKLDGKWYITEDHLREYFDQEETDLEDSELGGMQQETESEDGHEGGNAEPEGP